MSVELGFVEKAPSECLRSECFPSKVGGRPAWLARENLPTNEALTCTNCKQAMSFLLQVYAPRDGSQNHAFHRALFVFCCKNGNCHKAEAASRFKVYRAQLARENSFYSAECEDFPRPAKEGEDDDDDDAPTYSKAAVLDDGGRLCNLCGFAGEKACGGCSKTFYCSRAHQKMDWSGGHKQECPVLKENGSTKCEERKGNGALFPEFEIVIESEPENDGAKDLEKEIKLADEFMQEKEAAGDEDDEDDITEEDIQKAVGFTKDKAFMQFRKRVDIEPEQCLRYYQPPPPAPLWVSSKGVPAGDAIPACPKCKEERTLEFQIMPQLLYYLDVDTMASAQSTPEAPVEAIDFGVLTVYTCKHNCEIGTAYAEEFLWHQKVACDAHVRPQVGALQKGGSSRGGDAVSNAQ